MSKKINKIWLNSYDRPSAKFRCGEQCSQSCAMGPTREGVCQGGTECIPYQEGDRWLCSRPGKACEQGPLPTGECCNQLVCIPERNYRSRRQNIFIFLTVFLFCILLLVFTIDVENRFFSPGPLSAAHALKGDQDCTQCHVSSHQGSRLGALLINQLPTTTCGSCHDFSGKEKKAHNQFSLQANNLPILECRSCHELHKGKSHMQSREKQCGSCHLPHVEQLEFGHSEKFKVGSQKGIQFNHAKHFSNYMSATQTQDLECSSCHAKDRHLIKNLAKDVCQECHEQDFDVERNLAEFVSIPLVDMDTLISKGLSVGQWPEDMEDPYFSELTLAYLEQQPEHRFLVSKLRSNDIDISDLSEAGDQELLQVQILLLAYKEYLYLLSEHPAHALGQRDIVDDSFKQDEFSRLVFYFFPNLEQEIAAIRADKSVDSQFVLLPAIEDGNSGQWSVVGNKIMAHAQEHKDEFVLSWVEMLRLDSSDEGLNPTLQNSAKDQLFSSTQGLCLKCHQLDSDNLPNFGEGSWHSFLTFSHKTHENLAEGSCETCHGTINSFKTELESNLCFSCHQQEKQLSECSTCHSYHRE